MSSVRPPSEPMPGSLKVSFVVCLAVLIGLSLLTGGTAQPEAPPGGPAVGHQDTPRPQRTGDLRAVTPSAAGTLAAPVKRGARDGMSFSWSTEGVVAVAGSPRLAGALAGRPVEIVCEPYLSTAPDLLEGQLVGKGRWPNGAQAVMVSERKAAKWVIDGEFCALDAPGVTLIIAELRRLG